MNLQNIKTVARFECKTLRRTPVLTGIAILGLIVIFMLQYFQQGKQYTAFWYMIALPSCLPFINALLFSYLQSFLIILAVSEWRRSETRAETLEALRPRQINNSEYILGKNLGILATILTLNLVSITLSLAIHLFNSDAPFYLRPYIFYLFTFTLPSAIFLTGISTALSGWLRGKGISLIILLAFFLVSWYYLPHLQHGLFDYQATRLPNLFSDITGHAALTPYLLHRLFFLITGIATVILAIGFEKRLPHHVRDNTHSRMAGTGTLILALLVATNFFYHFKSIDTIREHYRATQLKHDQVTPVQVKKHEITVKQEKNQLFVRSLLRLENPTESRVEEIKLYLNPGLKITHVTNRHGQAIPYQREHQVIRFEQPLAPGDSITLALEYQGIIDERICYLDIPPPDYWDSQLYASPLHTGKHYAYVSDDYTLLTPESIWYPVILPPVNLRSPYLSGKHFTRFHLNVIQRHNKTIITQGTPHLSGDTTRFDIGHALPAISLCIGDYEKRSVVVDSVSMELYTFKNHFHLANLFEEMTDEELHTCLREQKEYFENHYNLRYPFKRFVLTETPVSFASNDRQWADTHEHVQPEIIMFPEKWITLHKLAPKHVRKLIATHKQSRNTLGIKDYISDGDIYLKMYFTRIALQNFSTSFTSRNLLIPFLPSSQREYLINKQNIRGLFNAFTNYWQSSKYPIVNKVIFTFESQNNIQNINFEGDIKWYLAHHYLSSHSFRDAINNQALSRDIFDEILRLKTGDLLNHVTLKTTGKNFLHFIRTYKNKFPFQALSFDSFIHEVKQEYDIELASILPSWYDSSRIPSYIIKDINIFQIETDDDNCYKVCFKIQNTSDTDGIISLTTNGKEQKKYYLIPANSYWSIQEKYQEKTHTVSIHTPLSQNIPSGHLQSFNSIINTTRDTSSGMFQLSPRDFLPNSDEIIVDNEDPGFRIIEPTKSLKLNYFTKEFQNPVFKSISTQPYTKDIFPNHWTKFIHSSYFGTTIKSIVCKKAGKGDHHVSWTAHLPKTGQYEIFIHTLYFQSPDRNIYEQFYTLKNQNIEENITITTSKEYPTQEWISIGTYHLNEGEITLILNDKGTHPHQIISADAVKWKYIKNKNGNSYE